MESLLTWNGYGRILTSATHIIAADGGTRHLRRLQIPPQTLIGDLDSISPELRQWLHTKKTEIIVHPAAKDESDLELALFYAVDHFPDAPHTALWSVGWPPGPLIGQHLFALSFPFAPLRN